MAANRHKGAFADAARIVGGRVALAAHLGVSLDDLRTWSTNAVRPPVHVLEALAQLLARELMKKSGRSDPAGARRKPRGR
jgi:hypothetical protein